MEHVSDRSFLSFSTHSFSLSPSLFLVGGIFILSKTSPPSRSLLCLSLSYILLPSPPSSPKPNIAALIFPLLLCFVFCSLWGQRIRNLCIFSICHSAGEWQRSGKEEEKKTRLKRKDGWGLLILECLLIFPSCHSHITAHARL